MKLEIDTTESDKVSINLDGKKYEAQKKDRKSQELLKLIDKALKEQDKTPSDLSEISINPGPGSYTGLRVGLSVANTMSWVLRIPINGKKVWEGEVVELVYD